MKFEINPQDVRGRFCEIRLHRTMLSGEAPPFPCLARMHTMQTHAAHFFTCPFCSEICSLMGPRGMANGAFHFPMGWVRIEV
jgi:hypothetical protein